MGHERWCRTDKNDIHGPQVMCSSGQWLKSLNYLWWPQSKHLGLKWSREQSPGTGKRGFENGPVWVSQPNEAGCSKVNLSVTVRKAFQTLDSGFPCLSTEAWNQLFSTCGLWSLGEVKWPFQRDLFVWSRVRATFHYSIGQKRFLRMAEKAEENEIFVMLEAWLATEEGHLLVLSVTEKAALEYLLNYVHSWVVQS